MLGENCYDNCMDYVAFCLLFFFFVVQCVATAALVNTLKALCILHSHEKLLPQVLKGVIGW